MRGYAQMSSASITSYSAPAQADASSNETRGLSHVTGQSLSYFEILKQILEGTTMSGLQC